MTNLSPMPDPNQLMRELNGLQNVTAPATLAPHVLLTLGLSDAYWQTATPIGSVFVAYNSRGVSAVHLADDAEAFERYFREHFHRRLDPTDAPDEKLVRAINRRLDGEKVDIRFDLRGLSDFEQAVLMKACVGDRHNDAFAHERPQAKGAGILAARAQMEQQLNCTARRMLRR